MEPKQSSRERIESLAEWSNMSINHFAHHIGLPRGQNLYQIIKGYNDISRNVANMIVDHFPEISLLWVLTGEGDMFSSSQSANAEKFFYNLDVESNIRDIETLDKSTPIILPPIVEYDLAMTYTGRAMRPNFPANCVVLLKKILPDMIIPGDECVVVTKKSVNLRIVKLESNDDGDYALRLMAVDRELYDDVVVTLDSIEAVYKVQGKILINS